MYETLCGGHRQSMATVRACDWNKAVVNKGYEGEDNALYCLTPGNPLHSFSFFNSPASCRHQTNVREPMLLYRWLGTSQGKKGSFEATAVQRTTFCT